MNFPNPFIFVCFSIFSIFFYQDPLLHKISFITMARTFVLFLMVTLLIWCEVEASGQVHVSYLGCYSEPPYDSLFYKAYLDYRHRIDWTKLPDLSHVTQACAQEAINRNHSYFGIKNYGVCSWGPDGLTITTKGTKGSGCFLTIGGPSAVSVFKISKTKVDGGWSNWGAWSACSLTCGNGRQTRIRTCTNPSPAAGGADCVGDNSLEVHSCNTNSCPVNGGWSTWGVWSTCTRTCDGGVRSRMRTCSNPLPQSGGAACQGPGSQSQLCYKNGCPVNGGWSNWGAWGSCTQTCGGGTQTRSRTCTSPTPTNGGLNCSGSSSESQACNNNTCPFCQEGSTSFDQCGQRCTCVQGQLVNCVRIRKEFTSMSSPERERYIKVILTASTDPKFKNDYDELINRHRNKFFSGIHGQTHFLTWHRYFMLLYENLLRQVACNFTIAYWDWSSVSGNPFSTVKRESLWHTANSGFGGNGIGPYSCVQTGPFREANWSIVPLPANSLPEPGPRCLARRFNGNPPDSVAVQEVLRIPASNFTDFELMLRVNLHDVVHCLIDGTMCSIDSAAAPEFFLHHGFIDKIWDEWQKKSDAHKNAFFPGIKEVMPGSKLLPQHVLNLLSQPGGVRVEYQSSRKAANLLPLLRGLSLSALHHIPRRQFSGVTEKIIKVFHLKPSEVKRAKELEKLLQPLY